MIPKEFKEYFESLGFIKQSLTRYVLYTKLVKYNLYHTIQLEVALMTPNCIYWWPYVVNDNTYAYREFEGKVYTLDTLKAALEKALAIQS